jgi:hypothetical protein
MERYNGRIIVRNNDNNRERRLTRSNNKNVVVALIQAYKANGIYTNFLWTKILILNLNTDFVLYTPNQDFTGADSFILKVNDGNSNNKSGKSRDFQTHLISSMIAGIIAGLTRLEKTPRKLEIV